MSKKPIRKVAVLGAGVMGSGIAAHCANAGIQVLLLDIVPPDLGDEEKKSAAARNRFAAGAIKKLKKAKPAAFFHTDNAELISVGNLDDDLEAAAKCDLIVEAVIERLDIKQALFKRLEDAMNDDTIIASNTSGLRIKDMLEGRTEKFQKNFLVTHFFNPPRYMKLLELVAGEKTSQEILDRCADFGKNVLGKGIVWAKDSPNFVANRIGCQSLMTCIQLMLEMDLAPEDIDQMTGLPMGHPKSATFRTGDMVGIDTLAHVVNNCYEVLTEDEDREVFKLPDFIHHMLENKLLGNKTRGGFYKKTKAGIETFDPKTKEYRPKGGNPEIRSTCKGIAKEESLSLRVKKLVEADGIVGDYAWKVLSRSLAYAARRVGEICDDIVAIDEGMRWGYNWELGPFQVWDALGFAETVERMQTDGIALPASIEKMKADGVTSFYRDGQYYSLLDGKYVDLKADPREVTLVNIKKGDSPVMENNGAVVWDIGDDVLAVRFKTKSNSIDPEVIATLNDVVDVAEKNYQGILITNDGDHFCVGANLFMVVMAAQQKKWDDIESMIKGFQYATQKLKYATVPVVAAPYGMTLGGGLEVCFAADQVHAAAETYAGLVEVGVGLIPGGAGNLNMLWRALANLPDGAEVDTAAIVNQVFKNIAMADVATSGQMAIRKGYFPIGSTFTFDRARQLHEAKEKVLGLARAGYLPPKPRAFKLPGESGIATLQMMVNTLVSGGFATEYDAYIAGKLARVLCGGTDGAKGPVTEDRMLEIEREVFLSLCGEEKSQARMQHMLMKNKPLRN